MNGKVLFGAVGTDTVGSVRILGTKPVSASPILAGKTWLRNRETGEAVKVIEVSQTMVRYQNDSVEGKVQLAILDSHFEVLPSRPVDADAQ